MEKLEFIAHLATEWARILPKAPAMDWSSLLTQHPRLAQADWEGILSRIEHQRRPITISYENYLKRCVYDVEDKAKQIHTFHGSTGEDELA